MNAVTYEMRFIRAAQKAMLNPCWAHQPLDDSSTLRFDHDMPCMRHLARSMLLLLPCPV